MIIKYVIPILAVIGFCFGIFMVIMGNKVLPPALPVADPPRPPYKTFVAGNGIIEANTENIAIGTQIPGVVSKIYVQKGGFVKADDPLFTIDQRSTLAEIATRQAGVEVAESDLENAKNMLALAESLTDKRALSVQELDNRRYAVQSADAKLTQAQANLKATETTLNLLTVRAPMDGQVMQLNIHLGEFAPSGALAQPLILFGNVKPMNVRVEVDENDAWRVKDNAPAIGYLRGNKDIYTPLKFVRFESYVVPKLELTGESTERVDTRVLQVIYSIQRQDLPIFVGQQLDVYIEVIGHNEGIK